MKNVLCLLGLHKASDFQYCIAVKRRGRHVYRVRYAVCKRCLKPMYRVTWKDGVDNA